MLFSPFSIAIALLGEERTNLSAFRTVVQFVLVLDLSVILPLGVLEGLRFVIMALPGLFSSFLMDPLLNKSKRKSPGRVRITSRSQSLTTRGREKRHKQTRIKQTNARKA